MRLLSAAETAVISAAALLTALVVFGLFVALRGLDPFQVYAVVARASLGSRFAAEQTLTQAAPLMLTALCTAIPARAGLLVIGGEGALVVGGVAVLAPVGGGYDTILLDCPPSLGHLTVGALAAADGVLVPLQCEYFALEGVSELLTTVRRIQSGINQKLTIAGILLTMYDDRTNLSRDVAEEIRRHFADKVYDTVVPRNVRLAEAPSHGLPIIHYDIKSRGAEAYLALAREFLRRAA